MASCGHAPQQLLNEIVPSNANYIAQSMSMSDYSRRIATGRFHSAAICADGILWTWGDNEDGQLGNGTMEGSSVPIRIMDDVIAVSTRDWSHNTAAITSDGTLWMWGSNQVGAIGDGTTIARYSPVKVMENVVYVSTGTGHTAAITNDGALWTWGWNAAGQLGDGTTIDRHSPVKIMGNVTAVSTSGLSTAAITDDGALWVWGSNDSGQIGDGTTSRYEIWNADDGDAFYKFDRHSPVRIMEDVVYVSVGGAHMGAITSDATLWMWGENEEGQLGDGEERSRYLDGLGRWLKYYKNTPEPVMENVVSVSAGGDHTMVITTDGTLWGFGRNTRDQLGVRVYEYSYWGVLRASDFLISPTPILENVIAVSAGAWHTAAMTDNGVLWTWGAANFEDIGFWDHTYTHSKVMDNMR